ncbi:MAG TPA: penicillin-binding transpeptidase domain-containing protein, partial [Streptosporangiaceae bacterium]|nr:penicillin-binding transpeptidase domain-containing protein [Streptosporangiaceae bacterium]
GNSDDTAGWDAWYRPESPAAQPPPAVEHSDDTAGRDAWYRPEPPAYRPESPAAQPPPAAEHSDDTARWDAWYRPEPPAYHPESPAYRPEFPPAQPPPAVEQPPPPGRHGRKRRKLPYVLVAVIVAAAGIGTALVLPRGGHTQVTGYLPTGSSDGQDAQQTARAFLRAWDAGHLQQAANYTDHPAAAKAALIAFQTHLHLRKLTSAPVSARSISPGSATPREKVRYAASARVAAPGPPAVSGTWRYHASLVTYQARHSQYWYVAWAPDDLAPNLTATTHLAAVLVAPRVTSVADAHGSNLAIYGDAGLNNIAAGIEASAPPGHGSPGLAVEIRTRKGKPLARTRAVVVEPRNVSGLATTIDGAAEQAALSAVHRHKNSSMVVIQPSTGKILAVANNAGFNDFALTARVAPGSTMKTITSTALFNEGVLTPASEVACPKAFTIQGIRYHNDQGESEPASTPFITDFAQSCNNAFTTQWEHLTNGRLAATARKYYGLDRKWNIGTGRESASYFNAPASASGSELAQEAFGEGQLTASPLAMASIAATIASGRFRQPYLTAGGPRVRAKPLPARTDTWLKKMMRAVVTRGTAAPIGFGPDVYAKTGTADIKGQGQPNSWLIAFEPSRDVAVACLVLNAGYGAEFAGPEVRAFFHAY